MNWLVKKYRVFDPDDGQQLWWAIEPSCRRSPLWRPDCRCHLLLSLGQAMDYARKEAGK